MTPLAKLLQASIEALPTSALQFRYEGNGTWEAASQYVDEDGCGEYWWSIIVADDGTFDVSESDRALTGVRPKEKIPCFDSLRLAQDYCREREAKLCSAS